MLRGRSNHGITRELSSSLRKVEGGRGRRGMHGRRMNRGDAVSSTAPTTHSHFSAHEEWLYNINTQYI